MNWRLYLFSLIGLVFAVALLGAGLVAFRFTDPQKSGVSNALLPLLLSGAMATCSVMSLWIKRDRLIGMIGIHAGLAVPLISAIALFIRGYDLQATEGLASPQVVICGIAGVLGVFVFTAMLRTRPPKEARDATPTDQA
jgi:hypothetical protein